jgi:hypothetical protein
MKKRHEQKLILIAFSLFILLNMPLLLLFDSSQKVLGFPAIYVYIFTIWLIGIALTTYILKKFDE